jgi:hypothetical protein
VRVALTQKDHDAVTLLPYVGSTFNLFSRFLSWNNIKHNVLHLKKISSFLQPVKNNLGLKTLRVYSIPSECCQFYMGQTSHMTDTRANTGTYVHSEHLYKSHMVEHSINLGG